MVQSVQAPEEDAAATVVGILDDLLDAPGLVADRDSVADHDLVRQPAVDPDPGAQEDRRARLADGEALAHTGSSDITIYRNQNSSQEIGKFSKCVSPPHGLRMSTCASSGSTRVIA